MNTIANAGVPYRPDIDGLRALAVLSVLFFHVGWAAFPGGFVGVDIFFVISGYLITRNIRTAIENEQFRLLDFYTRRFRRLFPALMFTFVFTSVLSISFLAPDHLHRYSKELTASIFSVSNFYFWTESGYFDTDSDNKPLLHTWSLALEEQFYLIWPTLMLIILGLNRRYIVLVFFIVFSLLSILLSEYWIARDSPTAFYLLPARIFEFSIGALLVWMRKPERDMHYLIVEILFLMGLLLVLIPITTYTDQTPFPGVHALYPCIGAAILIYSGNARYLSQILTNRLAVFIGLISYSVYLAHWPLIVFYKYWKFSPLSNNEKYLLPFISLLMGTVMWRYIEQPFRYRSNSPGMFYKSINSHFFHISSGLIILLLTLGILISQSEGWAWRFNDKQLLTANDIAIAKSARFDWTNRGCRIDQVYSSTTCDMSKPHQVLVFGNSHEPDGYNIWKSAYGELDDQNIIFFGTTNRCSLLSKEQKRDPRNTFKCKERVSMLFSEVFIRSIDVIVYSSNKPYASNKENMLRTLELLNRINPGIRFVFLGGYLNTHMDCSTIYNRFIDSRKCTEEEEYVSYSGSTERFDAFSARHRKTIDLLNPAVIDKFRLLCKSEFDCKTEFHGKLFTYDKHHLSFEFARHVGDLVKGRYTPLLIDHGALPDSARSFVMRE